MLWCAIERWWWWRWHWDGETDVVMVMDAAEHDSRDFINECFE